MRVASFTFLAVILSTAAIAAEPKPGDSCAGWPSGSVMQSGGPEMGGVFHQLKCKSGSWESLPVATGGGGPTEPCQSGNLGATCNDGAIYVGDNAEGKRMYLNASPVGASTWNDGSMTWQDIPEVTNCVSAGCPGAGATCWPGTETSCKDGFSNTVSLYNKGTMNTPAPYNAARLCDDPVEGWYLPSVLEMQTIWANRASHGLSISGTYWTSSEQGDQYAWRYELSTGRQSYWPKRNLLSVLCVRN